MLTPSEKKLPKLDSSFCTPKEKLTFSRELRQVLQEKNLLTAKSRMKVCSMLDSSTYADKNKVETPFVNSDFNRKRNFQVQAVSEIISSEHTYLKQLEVLMKFFVNPLKEQSIINDTIHTTIFGQLEMIYNLNKELLSELEHSQENVAQAFLKIAPFLKLYSVYAFDYKNSLLLVQDLNNKNPVFRKFLEGTESRPEVQKKLSSLMIAPIQRVPRYKLLLEQVLLYTNPTDTNLTQIKEAIKEVESTASHINSCIAEQEMTQKLINLQNSLTNRNPKIVKPSRRIIKEGVLKKITRTGSEINRYCVIMSDIFMYCKILKDRQPNTIVENSLECSCIFPLKKSRVYDLFPGNFKITCQGDGIIFGTCDPSLGRSWVSCVRDAIDLHIECRRTLRKESSKRKPIRKKEMKNFGTDFVLSPIPKRNDFETVFRDTNHINTKEDKSGTACFNFLKKENPKDAILITTSAVELRNGVKRKMKNRSENLINEYIRPEGNRISKLYKFVRTKNTNHTKSILKKPVPSIVTGEKTNYDSTLGFTFRYSDKFTCVHASNNDSISSTIERNHCETTENNYGRDVFFPMCKINKRDENSTKDVCSEDTVIQDNVLFLPPEQKRVKFDESLQYQKEFSVGTPYKFSANSAKTTLRQRIYDFFTSLF